MVKALGKGVLKVMSKMGISTVGSYTMAQIFEAVGLSQDLVDEYFTGTSCPLGGVGIDVLAEEVAMRHRRAYPDNPTERAHRRLETGGEYQWRREGEVHLFNPETVFLLQHATRSRQYDVFEQYTRTVDDLSEEAATLRGLFALRTGVRKPVPLDEVEPVNEIVKRFNTGAMSYGSIRRGPPDARDRHEPAGRAVQHRRGRRGPRPLHPRPERRPAPLGDQAGGQRPVRRDQRVPGQRRRHPDQDGAGRQARRGGQLPGKVYLWVARTRHSTPGVGLISPPPHHDIYSIEDLKQLIHDLKNANNEARIHVKLVSEVGVGTVAAGVSKAHADVVLISGHDGGTGAAPLTSLKHAGSPWELGSPRPSRPCSPTASGTGSSSRSTAR